MQLYRSWAGAAGSPSRPGTRPSSRRSSQDLAVGVCLVPPLAHHHGVQVALIWVAAALTVVTGVPVPGGRPAGVQGGRRMRVEIVAVGTELLLGQIADTNSAWLGDQSGLGRGDLALPSGRGGQPRAHDVGLPHRAGPQRRDHRLRRPGPDPGRHHPRGHRRRHGGRAGARPGDRRASSPGSSRPGAAPCRPTTTARPTCPSGATIIPQRAGHRARPHLPAGQQGDLRRARRALRDGRDVRAGHPARPARPHGRGRARRASS